MLIWKLTVVGRDGCQERELAVKLVQFAAGGVMKLGGEGELVHYTEHGQVAKQQWLTRGYDVVACERVQLDERGYEGLLADLKREHDDEH